MAAKTARETRRSGSGSVNKFDAVAGSPEERVAKTKKVASQPTVGQLKKAADRARRAGIEPLAKKYDKVADAVAEGERKVMAKPVRRIPSRVDTIDR